MWQKKKQSIMFAWFPVFFNEINDVVVYIEWIYVQTKQTLGIEILSELEE